jgi:hypothetical protein
MQKDVSVVSKWRVRLYRIHEVGMMWTTSVRISSLEALRDLLLRAPKPRTAVYVMSYAVLGCDAKLL